MTTGVQLVRAAGAGLHTEKTGTGPALVLISGGGGDAEMYADVVPLLAKRYTVITYDRRGNSRSTLDDPATPIGLAEQADDVVAILDHYGIGKAYVFGNSGGAIITLEVLARHEDRLLGAVVHEPPLVQLLPDSPEQRRFAELRQIADTEGPLRGFVAFGAMTMPNPPKVFSTRAGRIAFAAMLRAALTTSAVRQRITGRAPAGMSRLAGNAAILFRRELPEFSLYEPDIERLREVGVPWRLAVGEQSVGRPYYRPAVVLAARLGLPCVDFPGGHTEFQLHPAEFADRLTEILDHL